MFSKISTNPILYILLCLLLDDLFFVGARLPRLLPFCLAGSAGSAGSAATLGMTLGQAASVSLVRLVLAAFRFRNDLEPFRGT